MLLAGVLREGLEKVFGRAAEAADFAEEEVAVRSQAIEKCAELGSRLDVRCTARQDRGTMHRERESAHAPPKQGLGERYHLRKRRVLRREHDLVDDVQMRHHTDRARRTEYGMRNHAVQPPRKRPGDTGVV